MNAVWNSLRAILFFCAALTAKADLFVSGDSNIADPLIGIYNGVPGIDTGNQRLFLNILGQGNSVAVLQTTVVYAGGTASQFVTDVHQFFNSIPGKTSTILSGAIGSLASYNLLVVPLPDHAFTPNEITLLQDFLAVGNSVFFLGENDSPDFTTANEYINNDLAGLGSSMQIIPDTVDAGWQAATGSQIALSPYTAGVNHLTYAAGSRVSGGTYLFLGTEGKPFVMYTIVPEPSSLLLLCFGVLATFGFARKPRIRGRLSAPKMF